MTDMDDLFKSKTFCIAPWVHLHMWPNGRVYSCCMSETDDKYVLGNIRDQTIEGIIDSPAMQGLRENMLSNKPSEACRKCYDIENNGTGSLRNKLNHDYIASSIDLVEHGGFKLKYFDVRISNICNLKCRSCGPALSSKWYEDLTDEEKSNVPRVEKIFKDFKDFYAVIEDYIYDIEEIYFAGGEPLIMDEHWRLIARLKELNLKPKLFYQTNMTNLRYKKLSALDLWASFPEITVSASIDAYGKHAEFVRMGEDWQVIEDNIRLINEKLPHIELFTTHTVGLLNIFHLEDTLNYKMDSGLIKPGRTWLNPVIDPVHYSLTSVPTPLKPDITERLTKYIGDLEEKYPTSTGVDIKYVTNNIQMLINLMNSKDTFEEVKPQLKKVTERLDKLRGQDWREYLPELIPYWD